MKKTSLSGPAFSPWGRFRLLSLAVGMLPRDRAVDALPIVMETGKVVVAQVRGHATTAAAYAALERARIDTETARLGAKPATHRKAA